jgi:hypothetical protein
MATLTIVTSTKSMNPATSSIAKATHRRDSSLDMSLVSVIGDFHCAPSGIGLPASV